MAGFLTQFQSLAVTVSVPASSLLEGTAPSLPLF